MASTTTNLGLTKPAYSDDADISDINGNMDLIDAEAGKVRGNVAANYDSSETYAVGDYCLHDGSLYKCSTAISSPEAWTAGHWTQIKITGELSTLNGKIEKAPIIKADYDSVPANSSKTYTLPGTNVYLFFTTGTTDARFGAWLILSRSNGDIIVLELAKGSGVTLTTGSNNQVTIANTTGGVINTRTVDIT